MLDASVIITPKVVPVKRAMPGLSLEDRKRLVACLAESATIHEAAVKFGCSDKRLVELANREGFDSLVKDLRHPLLTAMLDPKRREELVTMIRAGSPVNVIAAHFKVTKSAVWGYFYRTGLDKPYLEAKRARTNRRALATPPGHSPEKVELFCLAAMLASRGLHVGAVPRYDGRKIQTFALRIDGMPVRVVRVVSEIEGRMYFRVHPTIADAWYAVILPRSHVVLYQPPHDGRQRYIPIANPLRAMEGREPPFWVFQPSDWPKPRSLGFKKRIPRAKP